MRTQYNSRLNTPYKTRKLICLRMVTDNIYTGYMNNYTGTGKKTDITSYVNTGKFSVLQYLQRSIYLLEELIKIIVVD